MADNSLVTSWAVCGIASAAARFIPVPLLDDVVRERAARVAVTRTLRAHGRAYPAQELQPLWDDVSHGRRSGAGRLRAAATKALLFPVRKYTAVFGAVRGVPNDVMRLVLLARTLDRRLAQGAFNAGQDLSGQAQALRSAVDRAIDGMDLRLLTAALSDGLSQSRGLSSAAVAFARSHVTGAADEAPEVRAEGPVAHSADQVTQVLRRPEIAQLLSDFDGRVDALLQHG